ncbi:hypothetical protein BJX99DRAFT_242796 [Aspergillus californicus]
MTKTLRVLQAWYGTYQAESRHHHHEVCTVHRRFQVEKRAKCHVSRQELLVKDRSRSGLGRLLLCSKDTVCLLCLYYMLIFS